MAWSARNFTPTQVPNFGKGPPPSSRLSAADRKKVQEASLAKARRMAPRCAAVPTAATDSKRVLGERNQNPAAKQIRAKLKADRKRWDAYVKFKREGPTSPDPRDGEQWE